MLTIDKSSRLPLYYQLMDILIAEIENQSLMPGDQLMPERELCEVYDVSRSTVRLAIQELEREGYIEKKHGKGTFVSSRRLTQNLLDFYSFTDEMKKLGKSPSSKVLAFSELLAEKRISKKLGLGHESVVFCFERLRLADGEPMMLETTYVPASRFPNLSKGRLESKALYDIFREDFGVDITMAEETFRPVLPTPRECERLLMEQETPSLMIERTTFEGERPIEYTVSVTKGDLFKYRVVLKK